MPLCLRSATLLRPLLVACLMVPLFGPSPGAASGSPSLTWSGQIRVRMNTGDRTFRGLPVHNDTELRTRVGLKLRSSGGNVHGFVQFQDSRVLGGRGMGRLGYTSGTLNSAANVDVHQAFLAVDALGTERIGLQVGRFEVNVANQRLFGAVGWHNVGRSWEGVRATVRAGESWRVHAGWLKRLELDGRQLPGDRNDDFDILLAEIATDAGITGLLVLEQDALEGPGSPTGNALSRWTANLYAKRQALGFDLETNLAWQGGTRETIHGPGLIEQNVSAYLAALEIGVPFEGPRPGRIAAALDYVSGDRSPTSGDYRAFDNLYYTGHKFRGFLDYHVPSGPAGLADWMLRFSLQPAEGWLAKVDWHLFRSAVNRPDLEGGETTAIGQEIDFVLQTTRIEGVAAEVVSGVFLPSEAFAGEADPNAGWYIATMLTANFSGDVN